MIANTEAQIWQRVIADNGGLAPDIARRMLDWCLPPADHARIGELSAKAQTGTLSEDEQHELDGYLHVGDFLAIIHSKARMALKHAGKNL